MSFPRFAAHTIVTHPRFEPALCFIIGLNALLAAVQHAGQGASGDAFQVRMMPQHIIRAPSMCLHVLHQTTRHAAQQSTQTAFTSIFIIELSLQLLASGVRPFLQQRWNCVDGAVTASAALVLFTGRRTFNLNVLRLLRLECVTR
jgi:hypothetical protein